MRWTVGEILPRLHVEEIHAEALAALTAVDAAAESNRLSGALIELTARFLRDLRHDPSLKLEDLRDVLALDFPRALSDSISSTH